MEKIIEKIKKVLREEGNLHPSEQLLDKIASNCEVHSYKAKQPIVMEGEANSNLYLIADGTARISYINDSGDEVTFGFGSAGAAFMSPYAYYGGKGAYFSLHACDKCTALVMSKGAFDQLKQENHEFALWVIDMLMHQFYDCEVKTEMMSASAEVRYERLANGELLKRNLEFSSIRPDVVKLVSDKVLASYLDINPTYLSKVKRRILRPGSEEGGK